jgi:hypothetical protein
MRERRNLPKPEVVVNQVIRWYRVHGNNCEFSVWKLIRLVNGSHGRNKIDESEFERARYYASKVPNDLNAMAGIVK